MENLAGVNKNSIVAGEISTGGEDEVSVSAFSSGTYNTSTYGGSGRHYSRSNDPAFQQLMNPPEFLGFESSSDYGCMTAEGSRTRSLDTETPPVAVAPAGLDRSVDEGGDSMGLREFPPLLMSLNENGRPRFILEKIRCDGRLVVVLAPNERQEVMKRSVTDGRLILKLIDLDQEADGDDQ